LTDGSSSDAATHQAIDDFLRGYDHVPREAVLEVLDEASRALVGQDTHGE
jgi:hypothetical protein